jgi:predicted transcriptional regulator
LEQILRKHTHSILEELASISLQRDKESLIESRANNVITSAINLMKYIKENYDAETADELERRLLNSIRSQDPAKFTRKVRSIREAAKKNKEQL